MKEHLRFAPEILRRLGEELMPHPDQGIVELVRNSYDADSLECIVELRDADSSGGSFTVRDTGVGMTRDEIISGWLILGRSSKKKRTLTALGRTPAGDKGLGRLGALRLGGVATLNTRPQGEPGYEYSITLEWSRFDAAAVVEDVPLNIVRRRTASPPGTTITVSNLAIKFGRQDVTRLARALLLLSDPFSSSTSFRPRLEAPGFEDLEARVRDSYFEDADYRITAWVDEHGRATAQVLDWKGTILFSGDHTTVRGKQDTRPYSCPPATFDLWAFVLSKETFSRRTSTVAEVRDWLQVVGGVHLYHHGLRVHPYGDPGHDWLDMNLRRARSPEERPSTNTSIGRVIVDDPAELLTQKTDRSGFVENDAFRELRLFAMETLDWAGRQRTKQAEHRRRSQRERSSKQVVEAKGDLSTVVDSIEPSSRAPVAQALRRYETAMQHEMTSLRNEVQLYRTIATVGTTTSVFAHESAKPASRIERTAGLLRRQGRKAFGPTFDSILGEPTDMIIRAAKALRGFAQLPLRLLQRDKRRVGAIDVNAVVREIVDIFRPFIGDAGIEFELRLAEESPSVMGSVAALESIAANFLVNSINVLAASTAKTARRRVMVDTVVSGDTLVLRFMDSGPGIEGIDLEDIWLPGESTFTNGTGLGLTIVRDAVADLGGSVTARAHGELGGAEFIVVLPVAVESSRTLRQAG